MKTKLMVLVSTCLFAATAAAQQPGGRQLTPEQRAAAREAAMNAPRPIAALDSVWIEELTWMEIRDAVKA